jgi:hypothetical protein
MMIGLMLFFDCILVDDRSLFVGLVKTDLNWFNNKSAFPLLSLMKGPRKTISKHKSIKSIRARQYTKPDTKRMRNTPIDVLI